MFASLPLSSELSAISCAALSVVLAAAGVAKLRSSSRTMISFQALGLPDRVVPPLALGVPVLELVLAVALWVPVARGAAAVVAAALFAAFTVIVARVVLQGRRVHCGCFGDLGRSDITWWTVGRNIALLAAAVAAGRWPPGAGPVAEALSRDALTTTLTGAIVLLTVGLVVTLRLTLDLLRRYGSALEQLDPTPPAVTHLERGDAVPDVGLVELDGPATQLADLWSHGPALIVYADPACSACKLVVPEVAAWADRHPEVVTAVVSPRSWRKASIEHAGTPVRWLLDKDLAAFAALAPPRTPSAFLVGPDGVLSDDVAVGNVAIRTLLGLAASVPLAAQEVVGADGARRALGDLLPDGGDIVLWNPRCGYCRQLGEALAEVAGVDAHGTRVAGAADLVFVSTGRLDEPWTLPWPVVVDPTGTVLHAARAPGTPSLVHLEPDGTVGAPLVGSDDVAGHIRSLTTLVGAP